MVRASRIWNLIIEFNNVIPWQVSPFGILSFGWINRHMSIGQFHIGGLCINLRTPSYGDWQVFFNKSYRAEKHCLEQEAYQE